MTSKQITWAAQHDWFCGANDDTGTVWVREITRQPDGTITESIVRFDDFQALREWAGY